MKSNIDQVFQDKLKSFQQAPSLEVWNTLENKLGELKTNKKIKMGRWVSIAASISLLMIASYQFYHSLTPIQSNISLIYPKDTLTIYHSIDKKIIASSFSSNTKKNNTIYSTNLNPKKNSKLIPPSDSIQKQDATFLASSSSSRKSITIEITIEEKNYVSMDQPKEKKKWINNTIRFLTRLKKAEVSWEELSLKNKNKNEEESEK